MARQKKANTDDLIDGAKNLKITNDLVQTAGGRPASTETINMRKKILRFAKKGISNIDLAEKLEVTTGKSQALAKPLIEKGLLEVKRDGGKVLYKTAA